MPDPTEPNPDLVAFAERLRVANEDGINLEIARAIWVPLCLLDESLATQCTCDLHPPKPQPFSANDFVVTK